MKIEKDWQKVVDMQPKGFLRIKTAGDVIIYGPLDKIEINNNEVQFRVLWFVYTKFTEILSDIEWAVLPDVTKENSARIIQRFPNNIVPYKIESIPEKGDRIIFSNSVYDLNILYVNRFDEVNFLNIAGFKEQINI